MNPVYDHIVAIVFIGIMFVWAVSVVPQMSFNNIQAVSQQQLRNTELNVFDTLLLDTGKGHAGATQTTNWGSLNPFNEADIDRFGLASTSESTLFTLDPDKVQRLVQDSPMGGISYERTKELLGLQGYDFMFQIIPPFNVTNIDGTKIDQVNSPIQLSGQDMSYRVRVIYLDGRPIPNAAINATIVYTAGDTFYPPLHLMSTTDEMGFSTPNLITLQAEPYSITVILRVTVSDVATIVVSFGKQTNGIVDINMIGDKVILTEPKDPNNGAIWIMNMNYYSGDGSLPPLYQGGKTQENKVTTGIGCPFVAWERTFTGLKSLDPVLIVIDVSAVENGRRQLIVAGPYQNLLGYTVFEYGAPMPRTNSIVTAQRSVLISGMTYTAQLILWKNSL